MNDDSTQTHAPAADSRRFAPTGPVIGVVGGGQLARMMGPAATELGIELRVLAESQDAGAVPAAASHQVGPGDDLEALRALVGRGVEGAIVGKALYAGAFTLPEALHVTELARSRDGQGTEELA